MQQGLCDFELRIASVYTDVVYLIPILLEMYYSFRSDAALKEDLEGRLSHYLFESQEIAVLLEKGH